MSSGKVRPNWLCKLGLHKWRYRGESVVVTWMEPSLGTWEFATMGVRWRSVAPVLFLQQKRRVLTKRRCLRCGISAKRKLVKNPDGTLSSIGW